MNSMSEPVIARPGRTWVQRAVIAMNLFLITASLGAALVLNYGYGRAAAINRVALGRSLSALPADAEPGERVMNILLVGSDSSANLDDDDPIQIGRRGERFGDVIIIAHIDERSGEIALLSLPRDLWVDIAGTGRAGRINHAFVSGGPSTLIETVEDEFDIPIHHYLNVDFAGFQGLVAAVGSVDVYFETPARDWNVNAKPAPRSQTGFLMPEAGCQSLDPETALAYVRSRYYQTQDESGRWITDPTSDLGRIRRQQDFLRRVVQQAIDMGARNPFVLRDLIDAGLENVAIDQRLTPQVLLDIGMTYRSFEPERLQTYSFPAVDGRVGQNQVLLPLDEEAEPLLALFGGAEFDDPSTVSLTVVGPTAGGLLSQGGSDRLGTLRRAGFRFEQVREQDLPPGVTIQHGPDGRLAAELVANALGEPIGFEEVQELGGRSLRLLVGADLPVAEGGADGADLAGGSTGGSEQSGRSGTGDSGDATEPPRFESDGGGTAVGPENESSDPNPSGPLGFEAQSPADTCG